MSFKAFPAVLAKGRNNAFMFQSLVLRSSHWILMGQCDSGMDYLLDKCHALLPKETNQNNTLHENMWWVVGRER